VALTSRHRLHLLQLSVPAAGREGFAHASARGVEAVCRTGSGVACTRDFLAAAHNRQRAEVVRVDGYLVGRFEFV
jgi:hypothetical protein